MYPRIVTKRPLEHPTQSERSEATTTELLDSARRLFGGEGYRSTLLDDVVREAGVTKGALYHHFSGKRELFQAVFEREQERLAALVAGAHSQEQDPLDGFRAGCRAFLEASLDPAVQRITLLDAPSVLGWEALREIEAGYSLALLRGGLELAISAGRIAPRPVAPLAHLLFGALCEGAMMVARSEDQRAATRDVLREVEAILSALTPPSRAGRSAPSQ